MLANYHSPQQVQLSVHTGYVKWNCVFNVMLVRLREGLSETS